jgi:N-acetylglucosamine repressor
MKKSNIVNLKDMRRINQAVFLHRIFREREITRTQLAVCTGLSPATVSVLTKELLEIEMLVEVGEGESKGGRKPILLQINPYRGYICGINVTTNAITYTLFNMQLEKLDEFSVENSEEIILQQLFESLVSNIDILLDSRPEVREKLIGIGISIPREYDHVDQKVLLDTGVSADRMKMDIALCFKYGKSIFIERAIHSRAVAEYYLGAARNVEAFIYIDISEEIQIAVVQKGKVVKTPLWGDKDLRHMVIDRKGPKCSCGKRGCLGVFLTTRVIVERVKKELAAEKGTLAYRLSGGDESKINIDLINQCANEGDCFIQDIIREMTETLCIGIHNMIPLVNIPHVVVGGKVVGQIHFFSRALSEAWSNYTLFQTERVRIHVTFLQQEEVNIGNGAIVLDNYLETYFTKDRVSNGGTKIS